MLEQPVALRVSQSKSSEETQGHDTSDPKMSTGDFQTRFASVMESMLKSSIEETTTLFETTVDELKAEICRIKKENDDLRARCSQLEERPSTVHSSGSQSPPQPCSEKRDTAVQCDLVPLRTMLVDQCQSLEYSSLQSEQQRGSQWEMENSLQDHNYGNADSQMTLMPVKEEESYDVSSLLPVIKQEDDEPNVFGGKVTNEERATACGNENEGPLIDHVCSTGEMFENDEETRVTSELRCHGMDHDLERAQNQLSEPEHHLVFTIKGDMGDKTESAAPVSPNKLNIINPSPLQRTMESAVGDGENSELGSLPFTVESLTRGCSSDRQKTSGSQQCSMETEAPPTENSSATETLNSPPAESPQASPVKLRERCSSATLQDAMLLVEAMNRSAGENVLSSFKGMRESPQTQYVPHMDTLQTMDEVPAEPLTLSSETCDAAGSPAITLLSTTQSTVQTLSTSPQVTDSHSTNKPKPHIKIVIKKPLVTASNIAPQQLPSSTCDTQNSEQSQQPFPRPVIRWLTTLKPGTANPNKIIVVHRPESLLMPYQFPALSPTQPPTLVSAIVAAQNNSLLSSSTERPSLSLLPEKTVSEASRKSVPVVPLHLTATSTDKQCLSEKTVSEASRKSVPVVPLHLTATSTDKQCLSEKTVSEASRKSVPVVPLHLTATSTDKQCLSEKTVSEASRKSVPVVPLHLTATSTDKQCLSEKTVSEASRKSVPVVPLHLTATSTDKQSGFLPHTKRQVSVVASGTHQSPLEQKLSAVVRLFRLPSSVSTKESVVVQRLLSYGFHERPAKMHVTSPNISPSLKETADSVSLNTSQFSKEKNNNQDMYHSEYVPPPTPLKVSASVFDKSTEAISKPSAAEPISNLEKEISSNAVQGCARSNDAPIAEKGSANLIQLISIPSKDGSHPHLQMSQTQFLAQLRVLPVVQAPQKTSFNDAADIGASSAEPSTKGRKRLENNTLMARLRGHLKTHLHTRRSETKPYPCTEREITTVRPKKHRLQNDNPNNTNTTTEHIPVKPKESGFVEDVASRNKAANDSIPNSPRTGLCRDPKPKKSVSELTRRSEPNSETTPKRGRRSRSRKVSVCSKNVKCSSVTHGRPSSTKDGANPKQTEGSVTLKNTKPTTRRISSSKGGATIKKTKSSSVSAKRSPSTRQQSSLKKTKSSAASPRKSNLSENVAKRKMSTSETIAVSQWSAFTQHSSSTRQFKRESSPLILWRKTTDVARPKSKSGSSSVCCPKLAKDGVSPGKTVATPPAKKARLIQEVTKPENNLSGLNANNVAKAAKATTSAKIKNSNQSKLQNAAKTRRLTEKTLALSPTKQASETPASKNQCEECGRVLSSSAALESHVALHRGSRAFSCTLCQKTFPDGKGLIRHSKVHSNGKIHICKVCGKGFAYSFTLTTHIQNVHKKVKAFACKICDERFFIKQQVEEHVRKHTGEKPFQCNLCEKRFIRKVKLDEHLRWHNGEKRHCCSYCGKAFLDANNLKRHKFIHTGEKPHSCPHCPKHFTQSGHLKKHLKNMHKIPE